MTRRIRLGIIGCGAITERAHLPAALTSPEIELTALVDASAVQLERLAATYGVREGLDHDYRRVFDRVDAVVLTVPNALHATMGIDFLTRGIHVLCEKPLAITTASCREMCDAAAAASSVLAVGFVTRHFPSTRLTRELLSSGFLGSLRSFDYMFGTRGGWAPLSGYNLSRAESGGGVLVVSGSHFLDRMCYLFDDVAPVAYTDDARGGVEAHCVADVIARIQGEAVPGQITLSKVHALPNRLRIVGDLGALEIGEGVADGITFLPRHGRYRHTILAEPASSTRPDYFRRQLEDFVRAIRTGTPPLVDGRDGMRSVRLTEQLYAMAKPMSEPWCDNSLPMLRAAIPAERRSQGAA